MKFRNSIIENMNAQHMSTAKGKFALEAASNRTLQEESSTHNPNGGVYANGILKNPLYLGGNRGYTNPFVSRFCGSSSSSYMDKSALVNSKFSNGEPLSFQGPKQVGNTLPNATSCMGSVKECHNKGLGLSKNKRYSKGSRGRKNTTRIKEHWSSEEDRILVQLVQEFGVKRWSYIARNLPGRVGKQCRERWQNHLRPDIRKGEWTEEEDRMLIEAHAEVGNKWAEITKRLPGRTENAIKNHWNAAKRRQFAQRRNSIKHRRSQLLEDYIKSLNPTVCDIDSGKKDGSSRSSSGAGNSGGSANETSNNTDGYYVPTFDFGEIPGTGVDGNMLEQGSLEWMLGQDSGASGAGDGACSGNNMPMQWISPMYAERQEMDLMEMIAQTDFRA